MTATVYSSLCCSLVFAMSLAFAGLVSAPEPALAEDGATSRESIRIIAYGDSLTAGYMLPPSAGFPAQLQVALAAKGYKVEVLNAGVSGDTTAAGLDRLEWTLQGGGDAAIVELGANDALRGIEPAEARNNLDRIIADLRSKNMDILIAGMKAPANWGSDYQRDFDSIFPDLAAKHSTALYPFFLDGVALVPKYMLSDGLHPNQAGVGEIVRRILPDVEALIGRVKARKATASK